MIISNTVVPVSSKFFGIYNNKEHIRHHRNPDTFVDYSTILSACEFLT